MVYASALAAFADESGVLESWIAAAQATVDNALFFVYPGARSPDPELAIYRNILVLSLVATAAWLWAARRWLPEWANEAVNA
jgi:hypothetical protein